MKRPQRMADFAERLAAARAGVEAYERVRARAVSSEATLPEYEQVFRDSIADRLLKIVSTLTVVRAARRSLRRPGLGCPTGVSPAMCSATGLRRHSPRCCRRG